MPTGTQPYEANAEIQMKPVTVETNLNTHMSFLYFSLIKSLSFISSKR